MLDTAPLTALLMRRRHAIATFVPRIARQEVATSTAACGEVIEHICGFTNYATLRADFLRILSFVQPLAPTLAVAQRYADIRRQLRPPYGPGLIGDIDTLIAATALGYSLTVVTTDTDFQRVPELSVMLIPRAALRG